MEPFLYRVGSYFQGQPIQAEKRSVPSTRPEKRIGLFSGSDGVMPLYDYMCRKCEKDYEVFVPLSQFDEEIKCPECVETLDRIISPVKFWVH